VQTWQLWATAEAFSAALTAVLINVGVQGIDAGLTTLFRTVTVAVVLALLLLASGQLALQGLRDLSPLSLGALVLSGLATGVSWYCYNRALQLGPVAGVAALDKLSVVLVALLAAALLGEQLGLKAWLGVGLWRSVPRLSPGPDPWRPPAEAQSPRHSPALQSRLSRQSLLPLTAGLSTQAKGWIPSSYDPMADAPGALFVQLIRRIATQRGYRDSNESFINT